MYPGQFAEEELKTIKRGFFAAICCAYVPVTIKRNAVFY
jgi:hypothetical protein